MKSSSLNPPHRLYSMLGLLPNAKDEEIRKAYYSLAKLFHPDRQSAGPEAEASFKSISQAASLLRDPARRRLYDLGDIDEAGNATVAVVHVVRRIHLYIAWGACFGLAATATVVWIALA
jgi:DnaJ-class molecular chaperone